MVAKISMGSSMFGALAYNQEKVDNGEAKVLFSNKMLLDEDGHSSIGGCMRSFEMQMPVHLSTKKPILHISINRTRKTCFRTANFPTSHGSICGSWAMATSPIWCTSIPTSTATISTSWGCGWTRTASR